MLFYLVCMFDDYWRINHRSRNSPGKRIIKKPNLRRSYSDEKHREAPIIPDDGGSQKGRPMWGLWGPHHLVARMPLLARKQVVWWPWPTGVSPFSRTSTPRNPKA